MALNSLNISSGSITTSEAVIQSLPAADNTPGRVRVHGHLNVTGNATAGLVTVKVRAGNNTTTGSVIYTVAVTVGSSAQAQIVFEAEDSSNAIQTSGGYSLTALAANAGTFQAGYIAAELLGSTV